MKFKAGEIEADKKLVSKSIVLLQPFDTRLAFFGPDLLMTFFLGLNMQSASLQFDIYVFSVLRLQA